VRTQLRKPWGNLEDFWKVPNPQPPNAWDRTSATRVTPFAAHVERWRRPTCRDTPQDVRRAGEAAIESRSAAFGVEPVVRGSTPHPDPGFARVPMDGAIRASVTACPMFSG